MRTFTVEYHYIYGETWARIQSRKIGVIYLRNIEFEDINYIVDQLIMEE